jgi:hypothetical protein
VLPASVKSAWSLRAGSPPRAVHIMLRSSISQLLQISCSKLIEKKGSDQWRDKSMINGEERVQGSGERGEQQFR